MALLAETTERPIVNVFRRMTCDAGTGNRRYFVAGFFMACEAIQPLVFAFQRKLGAFVVIETPLFPTVRVMALRARDAKPAFVLVVLKMAFRAL